MNVRIFTSNKFRKEAKRLVKKFPSLKIELKNLKKEIFKNPKFGIPIGKNCYKIRLSIQSKGKGKNEGARVITHLIVNFNIPENIVYLLTIYDKSEIDTITDSDLKRQIDVIANFSIM